MTAAALISRLANQCDVAEKRRGVSTDHDQWRAFSCNDPRVRSALRQFFTFLDAEGFTETNLMNGGKLPKRWTRAPKGIALEDFEKLLRATEESMRAERDWSLLLFLADTGSGVGGLVGLTVADPNLRRCWAVVN